MTDHIATRCCADDADGKVAPSGGSELTFKSMLDGWLATNCQCHHMSYNAHLVVTIAVDIISLGTARSENNVMMLFVLLRRLFQQD